MHSNNNELREQFEAWFKSSFHPDITGPYVKDQLFCAWQAAIASMQSERDHLAAQLADVVAENAALNEKMNTLATWPGVEFYSSAWEFNKSDGDTALEFICDVQTPATDRFLAEQRAQGVEMLAEHLSGMRISASETSVREFAAQLRNEVKG